MHIRLSERAMPKGPWACLLDLQVGTAESAVPPLVTLHELPALGAVELLAATDGDGELRVPFVLWTSGNETYVEYVLRGVMKAAKITVLEAQDPG